MKPYLHPDDAPGMNRKQRRKFLKLCLKSQKKRRKHTNEDAPTVPDLREQ